MVATFISANRIKQLMSMLIGEFARLTGLSADTLRYYEKIGLLPAVQRNAGGQRQYTRHDLDWVAFILRLKHTGMPLHDIQRYGQLRAQGAASYQNRQQLLQAHHDRLSAHIQAQREHLEALEAKIAFYQNQKPA